MSVRRAVIVTDAGFSDQDVVYAYYRCLEEGWEVDIATVDGRPVVGRCGVPLPLDRTAKPNVSFNALAVEEYDAVLLPGGETASERLGRDHRVVDFVAAMATVGKVVAGVNQGPWVMITAGVLRGRTACTTLGLHEEVVDAGGVVVDADVFVDGNIVTCSDHAYVARFMRSVFETTEKLAA